MHMSFSEFLIILLICSLTMLACRVIPLFVLKGKQLPEAIERSLGYIPPAAFAALVANDLLSPGMFSEGFWPAAAPLIATVLVAFVAVKTKSLLWSAVVGVVVYAILLMVNV